MRKIDFKALDLFELNGLLYETNNNKGTKDKKIIISIHGMSSNCFKKREDVIAKVANENGIDYFCFNNRGSELVKYIKKRINGKKVKELGGTSYEDIYDSHNDIIGAINKMIELGYNNIYLQGHSLGCTKIIYTIQKLESDKHLWSEQEKFKSSIKGIVLLSLVDIPGSFRHFLNDNFEKICDIAMEKRKQGKDEELLPNGSFIHPISVKSFIRYACDNKEIDFMNLEKKPNIPEINNINLPIFMRWGNINELILEDAKTYSEKINYLLKNKEKDIGYIDGANHSYNGKEELLGKEIVKFIIKN